MTKPDASTSNHGAGRSPIEPLHRHLEKCVTSGFYGTVEISFQHGRVCSVATKQTRKLDEL